MLTKKAQKRKYLQRLLVFLLLSFAILNADAPAFAAAESKVTISFKRRDGDSNLFNDFSGSDFAKDNRNRLLAEAFPARTLAAGKNEVGADDFSDEFDMQTEMKTKKGNVNQWPAVRALRPEWRHSDLKAVSYLYVYELFDKLTNPGGVVK